MIFQIDVTQQGSSQVFALQKVAEWNHNYCVISLVSRNDTLMLGDAISSITFLKLSGTRLEVVARDYGPLWPVCIEALSVKSVIGANVSQNAPSTRSTINTIHRVTTTYSYSL